MIHTHIYIILYIYPHTSEDATLLSNGDGSCCCCSCCHRQSANQWLVPIPPTTCTRIIIGAPSSGARRK